MHINAKLTVLLNKLDNIFFYFYTNLFLVYRS